MKKIKQNYFIRSADVSTTENTDGKKIITGTIPYNSKSERMGNHYEVIAPTAFNKTISDKANVYLFVNHDDSKVLGSTKSGTLTLTNTDKGLSFSCEIGNETFAADCYETIKRNVVNTLSFGFIPIQVKDDGDTETIVEAKLIEISAAVAFPAYAETTAETRSIKIRGIEMDFEELNGILSKETLTDEEKAKIEEVIKALQEKIGTDEVKTEQPSNETPTETAACNPAAADSTGTKTNTDEEDEKKKKEQEQLQRRFDFLMKFANC